LDIYSKSTSKKHKKKSKKEESSSEEESESEEEEKPKKKREKESKKKSKKEESSDGEEEEEEKEKEEVEESPSKKLKAGENPANRVNVPFQRIKADEVSYLKVHGGHAELERLKDNTFESKGGDVFGAKASEILSAVRGRDFTHAKNKKKRRCSPPSPPSPPPLSPEFLSLLLTGDS
jgi:hypothetical protein